MAEQPIITLGGWYQRTTLHLSEVYAFFNDASSKLNLSKPELKRLQDKLDLTEITRESGYFEYVRAVTKSGIQILYYEDGLYLLQMRAHSLPETKQILQSYFDDVLNPALTYLFSLGAPTPKILANIKTVHPIAALIIDEAPQKYQLEVSAFGKPYSQVSSHNFAVYKTDSHIVLVTNRKNAHQASGLIEMQIFFREFKDQLEKYLNIHRELWEQIEHIKEKRSIKGSEVEQLRAELDSYQKTISLISNRINQMGSYVNTRSSIAKELEVDRELILLFQYKFEALLDTLDYIKEVWSMTSDYVSQAIQVISDIQNNTLNASVDSLRVITTFGVIGGIVGYVATNQLPTITLVGVAYFGLLMFAAWLINLGISTFYRNRRYELSFTKTTKL